MEIDAQTLALSTVFFSASTFIYNWWYQTRTNSLELTLDACTELMEKLGDLEKLYTLADTKPYKDWTPKDKALAHKICGVFHLIGVLTHANLLPKKLLPQVFYYSIPRARYAVHDYLIETRENRGKSYWGGFDILVPKTKKLQPYVKEDSKRLIKEPRPEWVEKWPRHYPTTVD